MAIAPASPSTIPSSLHYRAHGRRARRGRLPRAMSLSFAWAPAWREGGRNALSSLIGPVREDAAPEVVRSPNSGPQALELDDLAVVDEGVDVGAVLLHVPAEDLRLGRLEHHSLQSELGNDPGDEIGSPFADLLGDAPSGWSTR